MPVRSLLILVRLCLFLLVLLIFNLSCHCPFLELGLLACFQDILVVLHGILVTRSND